MGDEGLELLAQITGETAISDPRAAALIAELWDDLPEHIRAAMLALLESAR